MCLTCEQGCRCCLSCGVLCGGDVCALRTAGVDMPSRRPAHVKRAILRRAKKKKKAQNAASAKVVKEDPVQLAHLVQFIFSNLRELAAVARGCTDINDHPLLCHLRDLVGRIDLTPFLSPEEIALMKQFEGSELDDTDDASLEAPCEDKLRHVEDIESTGSSSATSFPPAECPRESHVSCDTCGMCPGSRAVSASPNTPVIREGDIQDTRRDKDTNSEQVSTGAAASVPRQEASGDEGSDSDSSSRKHGARAVSPLHGQASADGDRSKDTRSHVSYHGLFEQNWCQIGLFRLARGATLSLHDHPCMCVVTRMLYGSLDFATVDWVQPHSSGTPPAISIAQRYPSRRVRAPGIMHTLPRRGNIHSMRARTSVAYLDVFFPPYADARPCTYFRALPLSEEDRAVLDTLTKEKGDYVRLVALSEKDAGFQIRKHTRSFAEQIVREYCERHPSAKRILPLSSSPHQSQQLQQQQQQQRDHISAAAVSVSSTEGTAERE
ncbi:MAG: hypothetical protein MHM6MM_006523 [Cercozoa sp. M6MM]